MVGLSRGALNHPIHTITPTLTPLITLTPTLTLTITPPPPQRAPPVPTWGPPPPNNGPRRSMPGVAVMPGNPSLPLSPTSQAPPSLRPNLNPSQLQINPA